MNRDDAIKAVQVAALKKWAPRMDGLTTWEAGVVVDAVDPIIRADERERIADEVVTCGLGDCATYRTLNIIRDRGGVYGYSRDAAEAITSAIADIIRHGPVTTEDVDRG